MALLIHRATYLLRDARRIERDVDLLIEGNRIAAVGRDLPVPPGAETIDAQGCAVIPGLVNAHTHLYQNFLKGTGAGLKLVDWCQAVLFPMVDVILQEQLAGNGRIGYLWSALGALEMIRAGTTCCQNLDVAPYLSLAGVLEAWRDVGLRGVGAITLANRWIPPHLLLDEQAEAIFATTDPLAERVRRIGGTTIRSISHVNQLQTIEDDNDEFVDPDDMLHRLMEDNKHIAAKQREAHGICDENGDAATAGLLEDVIDGTERRTWFLYEYLKDTDRFD